MFVQVSTRVTVAICLLLTAMPGLAAAQSADAGRVKAAVGAATIVRQGQSTPARVGDVVYPSDILRTGADGQLAVMLKDDTRLSLGPGSEVALSTFEFAPAEARLSLVLRIARGAMSYASGQIAKLMPAAIRLETPTSVIGVRGTHALIRVEAP